MPHQNDSSKIVPKILETIDVISIIHIGVPSLFSGGRNQKFFDPKYSAFEKNLDLSFTFTDDI